jgi:hypothetical protein
VQEIFPAIREGRFEDEQFNSWNFWRIQSYGMPPARADAADDGVATPAAAAALGGRSMR